MNKEDLCLGQVELSNGTTLKVVHNIGDLFNAAFENWLIRAQSDREEAWFQDLTSECLAHYIRSKGDWAITLDDYLATADEEE